MRKQSLIVIGILISSLMVAQRSREGAMGGPIPEGTQVTIRMIDSLSSETAHQGDIFQATLEQPIVDADGRTLYAKDADVTGRVLRAHPSGRLSDPGELELTLTSITASGRSYPVNTQPWLDKGESHTKSNTTKIGGGAALGAIIGAVAGGGKGAAIGAGVGAGAGTGVAAASGKKDAKIESEALLHFITGAPAASPQYGAQSAQGQPELRPREYRDNDRGPTDASRPVYDRPTDTSARMAIDLGRRPAFRTTFTNYDRQNIRGCFVDRASLPPDWVNRDSLHQDTRLQRNSTLPPDVSTQALPDSCNARLPRLPADWSRLVVGRHVLLVDPDHRVADMFNLDEQE